MADGCTDLITNSNVVWTLLGAPIKGLKDGDQVKAVPASSPQRVKAPPLDVLKKMSANRRGGG